jgi:predicted RNA-binding Zn-ribbon protein involved in translation (DUF1610 family)
MRGRAVEAIGAAAFCGRTGMSNDTSKMAARESGAEDDLILPVCLRCGAARMSLTCTMEVYSGYQKRMFECPVCGDTTTQWARVPD